MVTRVSGLNSGLDIDSLVSSLMKAEKVPLDSLKQKKTSLTWTTNAYREINTKMSALKNSLDNMRLSGDWKQNKAVSSNENAVTVTANGSSSKVSHNIEVLDLAEGTTIKSDTSVSNNPLTAGSVPTVPTSNGATYQIKVNLGGVTRLISIPASTTSNADTFKTDLQDQINNAFGQYQISAGSPPTMKNKIDVNVDSDGKLSLVSNLNPEHPGSIAPTVSVDAVAGNDGLTGLGFSPGQSNRVSLSDKVGKLLPTMKDGSFTLNGQVIEYKADETLGALLNRVNNTNTGVSMSYDSASDKFILTSKDSGSAAAINLSEDSPGFLAGAKITTMNAAGKDAKVKIDGVESYQSSNTFTSGGVTYSIKQKTAAPVSISVSQDVDSTVAKIKAFVTSYNDAIELLSKRVNETKTRSYKPLTDDQRKAMSDTEITNWENIAKLGILHNDSMLKSTISSMRSFATESVSSVSNSSYNSLYKIGINTMSYSSTSREDAGKLVIDEEALKKALIDDPDSVTGVFSNQPDGIAQQMYNQVTKSIKDFSTKAGGSSTALDNVTTDLGLQINNLNKQIESFTTKLASKEDYYYKMFATMDSAVGKSNSTLAWLSKNS